MSLIRVTVCLFAFLSVAYLFAPTVRQSSAHIGEFVFDSVLEPVGVAASTGRFYITHPACGDNTVVRFSDGGSFATLVTIPRPNSRKFSLTGKCFEDYVAIASPNDFTKPGRVTKGGFPSNSLLVTQGRLIYQVLTLPTVSVSLFAEIPSSLYGYPCSDASATGITFDRVGNPVPAYDDFDANAIATCSEGTVWMIDKHGKVKPIANVPAALYLPPFRIEGPESIPTSYGSFGGRVLVHAETKDRFYAVSRSGAVTNVGQWPKVEGGRFVPQSKCNFVRVVGQTPIGATFFTTVFTQGATTNVWAFPVGAFGGLGGKVILSSAGTAGFGRQSAPGNTPTLFHATLGRTEDMTFADCDVPLTVALIVKGPSQGGPQEGHIINPTSKGAIQLEIRATRTLKPAADALLQDADNNGFLDTVTFGTIFDGTEQSIPVGNCKPQHSDLRCHALTERINWSAPPASCFTKSGNYKCKMLVKFRWGSALLAPGVDPDGEGFN
jgi:hypothetical protein